MLTFTYINKIFLLSFELIYQNKLSVTIINRYVNMVKILIRKHVDKHKC